MLGDSIDTLTPAGMIGGADMARYPHLFPPPGFIQVDRNGRHATTAADVLAGEIVLETIEPLASGYSGWIRTIALESASWNNVFFTMKRGGTPLRDYAHINTPLGSPETPRPIFIELVPNVTFQITASPLVAALGLRWAVWGWYYKVGI